jgi:hypothetical protein
MLFKEIIPVCTESCARPIKLNAVTDLYSRWYILLPFGFKRLTLKIIFVTIK